MTDEERPPEIVEALHKREAKKQADRRLIVIGAVAFVAVLVAAVLATLLWTNSQANVNRLAQTNDAQRSQFEYCKTAPKNDPKCQTAVAPPAEKVVQGPQGIQGIQGIQGEQGPPGPQGPRGIQGLPGNSPRCLLEPSRCVGASGPAGPEGPQGDQGVQGKQGEQGEQGATGDKGDQGEVGPAGPAGPQGEQGPAGTQGPQGDVGPAGPDKSLEACTTAGGTLKTLQVLSPADPPQQNVTSSILVCVLP